MYVNSLLPLTGIVCRLSDPGMAQYVKYLSIHCPVQSQYSPAQRHAKILGDEAYNSNSHHYTKMIRRLSDYDSHSQQKPEDITCDLRSLSIFLARSTSLRSLNINLHHLNWLSSSQRLQLLDLLWSRSEELIFLFLSGSFSRISEFLARAPTSLPALEHVSFSSTRPHGSPRIPESSEDKGAFETFLENLSFNSDLNLSMMSWELNEYLSLPNVFLHRLRTLSIVIHAVKPTWWHALDFVTRHVSSLLDLTLTIELGGTLTQRLSEGEIRPSQLVLLQLELPNMALESLVIKSYNLRGLPAGSDTRTVIHFATNFILASISTVSKLELRYPLYTNEIQEVVDNIRRHRNYLRILRITSRSINPQLFQSLADALPQLEELIIEAKPLFLSNSAGEREEIHKLMEREFDDPAPVEVRLSHQISYRYLTLIRSSVITDFSPLSKNRNLPNGT
jgi:hypothetical protein